jgi:serine/threonine protein kinase/formylglycine-generating enzyme required for sulfatase activity
MDRTDGLGHLKSEEWNRLTELVGRFESAWQTAASAGETVDLREFVPSEDDPLRRAALLELIKTDLEIRWRQGPGVTLEYYLERFPELGGAEAVAPDLIYEEYRIRQLYGDRPPLDSYRALFSAQFAALEQLIHDQPLPTRSKASGEPTPRPSPAPSSGKVPAGAGQILSIGGGYELLEYLGGGGFGNVWRARAPGGVDVAVKRISRPLEHSERQRELQALELIKQLRHPYLLQTHAFFSLPDELIIVMELADGSLRDRLKQYRKDGKTGIPPRELLSYFHEAAEALDFLHAQHMQHRDVKPDNILFQQRHAKVADFGLARELSMDKSVMDSGSGTPPYTPPEVWLGKIKPGADSDQYSLAVSYFELRMDRRLYPGTAMMDLMMAHCEGKPDLSQLGPAEREALARALEKNPAKRYPTCLEFVQALEAALASELKISHLDRTFVQSGNRAAKSERTGEPTDPNTILPDGGLSRRMTDEQAGRPRLAPSLDDTKPGWRPSKQVKKLPTRKPRFLKGAAMALLLVCAAIALYALVHEMWLRPKTKEVDFLPDGVVKTEGAEIRVLGDKRYYDRINVLLPDKTPMEFVLIPPTENVPAFYIMVDKVSVDEFRRFAATGVALSFPGWSKVPVNTVDPDRPVMYVYVEDAYQFARSLGGNLPTASQWDAASGYFRPGRGVRPFLGPYQDCDAPWDGKVSVALKEPTKRHAGKNDYVEIEEFGARVNDLAGNGREWTRTIFKSTEVVPLVRKELKADARVVVRGQSYFGDIPLRYKDFDPKDPEVIPNTHAYLSSDNDIGFRVVIEP